MTPAEAARSFTRLLDQVTEAVSKLPALEMSRASQILRGIGALFDNVVRSSTDDMERKVTIDAVRGQITELERLVSGQRMLFANVPALTRNIMATKVALRFVEAFSGSLDGVFKELFDVLDGIEDSIQGDILRQIGVKPPPAARRPRVKAPKTYAQAQDEILRHLRTKGWAVKDGLKIPHATSPDGGYRFWFKPQAIYGSTGPRMNDFGEARSVSTKDYRLVDTGVFTDGLIAYASRKAVTL